MARQAELIETTVSEVAAELASRGLDPHDRVTLTFEPDELIPGRREALRVWSRPGSPMATSIG